jgi:hypothetical protein
VRRAIGSRAEIKGENRFSFVELLRNREKDLENVEALSLSWLGGESVPLDWK